MFHTLVVKSSGSIVIGGDLKTKVGYISMAFVHQINLTGELSAEAKSIRLISEMGIVNGHLPLTIHSGGNIMINLPIEVHNTLEGDVLLFSTTSSFICNSSILAATATIS